MSDKKFVKPENLVIHSRKSKKTADEDKANFYASNHGKELNRQTAEHQAGLNNVANELVRNAMKEERGLRDEEIDEALNKIELQFSHRRAVLSPASKSSSAVKRFVASTCPKTGKAIWVPQN